MEESKTNFLNIVFLEKNHNAFHNVTLVSCVYVLCAECGIFELRTCL